MAAPRFGIILRSPILADWPDIDIAVLGQTGRAAILKSHSIDSIAVLFITDAAIESIEMTQHADGVAFGFDRIENNKVVKVLPDGELLCAGLSQMGRVDLQVVAQDLGFGETELLRTESSQFARTMIQRPEQIEIRFLNTPSE